MAPDPAAADWRHQVEAAVEAGRIRREEARALRGGLQESKTGLTAPNARLRAMALDVLDGIEIEVRSAAPTPARATARGPERPQKRRKRRKRTSAP